MGDGSRTHVTPPTKQQHRVGRCQGNQDSAGSIGVTVSILVGDAFSGSCDRIRASYLLLLGAGRLVEQLSTGVGAGCFAALDKGIGIAAVFAGAIQAGLNSCSPGRNGAYFGLLLVNGAVDLVNPSGAGGRLIKEGIESVIDASTLTAQTAVTGTCSATMAHAPGRTIREKGQ